MKRLTGRWRIVEMDLWDQDAIDLVGPGYIEVDRDGTGEFGFIAVRGWMDCRWGTRDGRPLVEFSWDGDDEGDEISGRGWAVLGDGDVLSGHLFIHRGDDSAFRATPFSHTNPRDWQ
ncbi:hypothetical protein MXD62_07525 [Frankia sp. Mgl5]|uniref:hypothetical protein n=1 Tax=Frankia sp. Mgl5 TaxID=2933793 RepID=UPI00200C1F2E|nr:hypothetical protein [Frankia sp. Mgl5]MCK9927016.1 hypothetical protein [Frankia sp. Mgl5]